MSDFICCRTVLLLSKLVLSVQIVFFILLSKFSTRYIGEWSEISLLPISQLSVSIVLKHEEKIYS